MHTSWRVFIIMRVSFSTVEKEAAILNSCELSTRMPCGSLIPFTRANAQWVFHGFYWRFNLHFRVNSLFHQL